MRRQVAIIGSGHSGLCLAIGLQQSGIADFTIYEKADQLGGTWRDNGYPGAACDSPSFAYCYSFHQKTDWSRKWAPRDEILAYQQECAATYGLHSHLRTGCEVQAARYDDARSRWQLQLAGGETAEADILVSAVGQLSRPRLPALPGRERFAGAQFHSARWDPSVALAGRRVAVIGSAASAVQLVPAIADEVAELRVFQRSPNWLLPKNDRRYPRWERWLYAHSPGLARLYRWWLWLGYELRYPVIRARPFFTRRATEMALEHLHEQVRDPELRAALTPDYTIAAKRVLISDDYYPALQRDNVHLIDGGVSAIDESGVIDGDGGHHPVDVIIYATGFDSTDFLAPMEIVGSGGRKLATAWGDGAQAYLGMSVAGFPNLFLMYGPNTNLGHNSIIFMIECQTRYILDCLRQVVARDLASFDVRSEAQADYNDWLASELSETAWAQIDDSWYRLAGGRITNNWPGSTVAYWWRTRRADLRNYRLTGRREAAADVRYSDHVAVGARTPAE